MKMVLISLALVVMLTLAMAVPAMAVTVTGVNSNLGASVTVTSYISATITDNTPGSGINFGNLNPGTSNNPELAQNATLGVGAVTVTVGAETNEICMTSIEGNGDFSDGGSHTFALSNATWNNSTSYATAHAMTTSYTKVGSDSTPGTAQTIQIYHWLSIPNGQYAATYTTTFRYKVDTSV